VFGLIRSGDGQKTVAEERNRRCTLYIHYPEERKKWSKEMPNKILKKKPGLLYKNTPNIEPIVYGVYRKRQQCQLYSEHTQ
jgi:hypothetical protein